MTSRFSRSVSDIYRLMELKGAVASGLAIMATAANGTNSSDN